MQRALIFAGLVFLAPLWVLAQDHGAPRARVAAFLHYDTGDDKPAGDDKPVADGKVANQDDEPQGEQAPAEAQPVETEGGDPEAVETEASDSEMAEGEGREPESQEDLLDRIRRARAALQGLPMPSPRDANGKRKSALGADRSERTRVFDFFRYEVQGKKLVRDDEVTLQEDEPPIDVRVQTRFTNLKATETGLTFEMVAKYTNTYPSVDDEGQATGEVTRTQRRIARQVELSQQKSTGQLVGFARTVTDSDADPTGTAWSIMVEPSNDPDTLVMDLTGLVYKDGTDSEPISDDEIITLRLLPNGVLELHQIYQYFTVDSKGLRMQRVIRKLVSTMEVVSYDKQPE